MKLDIGCGPNRQKGFKGTDVISGPTVDFVLDLEKFPWEPFADNSCDEIYTSHYVEKTKDLIKFMDEMWRICTPNAKITIVAPYYTSIRAFQDPMATRLLSEATWPYFNKEWRTANKLDHYPIKSDFAIEKIMVFFNQPWDKKSEEAREFAKTHYWNVVSDILVELKAVK